MSATIAVRVCVPATVTAVCVCVLVQELVSRPDTDVVTNVIDKDLDRTFPSHVLFKKESG